MVISMPIKFYRRRFLMHLWHYFGQFQTVVVLQTSMRNQMAVCFLATL